MNMSLLTPRNFLIVGVMALAFILAGKAIMAPKSAPASDSGA